MSLFYFDKEKLTYEKIPLTTYVKCAGVAGAMFVLGWVSSTNETINKIVHLKQIDTTIVAKDRPFSEDALIELLKNCNIKYPHIVLAQAKLESNNFKSKIFKQNNNMFGMRKARQRITTAETEKSTYAYYRDWVDSVHDYAMYQSSVMSNVPNESEYFNKLGERYAEDTLYISKLKNIIKIEKLKNIFEE